MAMATETMPASSEERAPQTMRARMSRPISSVPSQCAAEGAVRIAPQSVATGSGIGRSGARIARATKKATSAVPNIADLWWRNFFNARFPARGMGAVAGPACGSEAATIRRPSGAG